MATTQKRKTRAQVTEEIAVGYVDALSTRDPDAATAQFADEVIDDVTPVGILRGPAEVREFLGELFAAFPEVEFTVEQSTASARVCAVQWRAHGTFRGAPFQGIEPTGRRVEIRGCDCVEVEGRQDRPSHLLLRRRRVRARARSAAADRLRRREGHAGGLQRGNEGPQPLQLASARSLAR